MKFIRVEKPHGFLIWRGKQSAIGTDKSDLPTNEKVGIVCENELYGEVILSEPVHTTPTMFREMEEEHRVREVEQKIKWSDANALYVYRIKQLTAYEEMIPVTIKDGILTLKPRLKLNQQQRETIEKAELLPKEIKLKSDVIALDDSGLVGVENKQLSDYIKVLFEENKAEFNDHNLPLYDLCLVRKPALRFKERVSNSGDLTNEKQEGNNMPYEIQETEEGACVLDTMRDIVVQCYEGDDAMDKATVLLKVLMDNDDMPEPEMPDEDMPMEEESIEEKQEGFDDTEWDGSASNWDTAEAYCSDCLLDFNPSGEDKNKGLCKLPFRLPGKDLPNVNALRAIGGGNGITAVTKPDNVSADEFDNQMTSAANKLIAWWTGAFDKPAPDSIYALAGKEPPESESQSSDVEAEKQEENSELSEIVSEVKEGKRLKTGWVSKLKELMSVLGEMVNWAEYKDEKSLQFEGSGFATKEAKDGTLWFITWSSNAFQDRDGQIITTKALEDYVEENINNPSKGFFNLWHIPGTDFAKKEWQGVVGRILVEAGPFLDNHQGRVAKQFFNQYPKSHPDLAPEGWGASIEFRYLPEELKSDVFNWVWITRTSVLAKASAANLYTKSNGVDTKMTKLTDEQIKAGQEIFGSEWFEKNIVQAAEKATEQLEQEGVQFKQAEKEGDVKPEVKLEPNATDEALKTVALAVQALGERLAQFDEKITSLEKQIGIKQVTEKPRAALAEKANKRASESEETQVTEDDRLLKMNPLTAKVGDKSGASHYFAAKK